MGRCYPSFHGADNAMSTIAQLRRILKDSHTIAVVGLSADWFRPSYFAAKYMQEHGYKVIPVNPKYTEILGQRCYPDLKSIPDKVDIVDVFRKSDDCVPIAQEAVAIGAKAAQFLPLPQMCRESRQVPRGGRRAQLTHRHPKDLDLAARKRALTGVSHLGPRPPQGNGAASAPDQPPDRVANKGRLT